MTDTTKAPKLYRFERYRNGQLMAEGIKITKAYTFKQATLSAAKIADAGDVLVFDPLDDADHVNELIAAAYELAAEKADLAQGELHQCGSISIDRDEVRALIKSATPDDARAALAARDKRVREEALREGITRLAQRFAIYSDNGQSLKAMGFSEAAEELESLITKDTP